MEGFVDVIDAETLLTKGRHLFQIEKRFMTLFVVDKEIFAVDELCPHRAGPLSEGSCEGHSIVCPWHGAKFDLRSGNVISGPAPRGLRTYKICLENGRVYVEKPTFQTA